MVRGRKLKFVAGQKTEDISFWGWPQVPDRGAKEMIIFETIRKKDREGRAGNGDQLPVHHVDLHCFYRDGAQQLQVHLVAAPGKVRGVRDSSAGIGTLTYLDQNSGLFTGLGHAVCDVDTGEVMPLSNGEVVPARITACHSG